MDQSMIGKIWRGETLPGRAEAYPDGSKHPGDADFAGTTGNRGGFIMRRVTSDKAEFLLLTLWDEFDSIASFAGDEVERARYYPEDDEVLTL